MGPGLVAAGGRPAGLVLRHPGRTGHRRPPGMDRDAGDGGSVAGSDDCLSDQQDQYAAYQREQPEQFQRQRLHGVHAGLCTADPVHRAG